MIFRFALGMTLTSIFIGWTTLKTGSTDAWQLLKNGYIYADFGIGIGDLPRRECIKTGGLILLFIDLNWLAAFHKIPLVAIHQPYAVTFRQNGNPCQTVFVFELVDQRGDLLDPVAVGSDQCPAVLDIVDHIGG